MKVEVEDIGSVEKKITVIIPSPIVDKEIALAYRQLNSRAKVKGFRIGRVPRSILERHYKELADYDVSQERILNNWEHFRRLLKK